MAIGLEFDLGETVEALRQAVRAFARREIAPRAELCEIGAGTSEIGRVPIGRERFLESEP